VASQRPESSDRLGRVSGALAVPLWLAAGLVLLACLLSGCVAVIATGTGNQVTVHDTRELGIDASLGDIGSSNGKESNEADDTKRRAGAGQGR
jgi:hypothetical protein